MTYGAETFMNHPRVVSRFIFLLWCAAVVTGLLELAGLRAEVRAAEGTLLKLVHLE